jgi:N4-gp56 family major capsid protein
MGMQTTTTQAARVNKLKGEIIAHAEPKEVLGITGDQKDMAKNVGNTYIFRRWLPFGGTDNKWITGTNVASFATNHQTAEGVTPSADTLQAVDITVVLQQYACLYAVTDQTVDLYEDNIPAEMKAQTGQRIGLVREMVRYGILKGMTNAFFAGGTTRGTVTQSLTLNMVRKVTKSLNANHAELIGEVIAAGPHFNTSPVEETFLVFCHTDMAPAIRDLPGFTKVVEYAGMKRIHPLEIGACETFRFILSPELAPYVNAGAAVGTTGLFSTGAATIDVYPVIIAAAKAWGQIALKGKKSLDVTWIPPGTKDTNDPLGQRGYIGAKTYFNCTMLNQGWAAVVECGTPDLA